MAASKGKALYDMFPKSDFAHDIKKIAKSIEKWPLRETPTGHIEFFLESLIQKSHTVKTQTFQGENSHGMDVQRPLHL